MEFLNKADQANFILKHLDGDDTYKTYLLNNIRPDGRGLLDHRSIYVCNRSKASSKTSSSSAGGNFSYNSLLPKSSDGSILGSSIACIGSTYAVCNITMMIGKPSLTLTDCGDIEFDINLWSVCSPAYESMNKKNKNDKAHYIEKVLDDVIANCNIIDLKQLCIKDGVSAIRLCVNITFLGDDGNLTDVAILALMSALMDTSLPDIIIDASNVFSISDSLSKQLIISTIIVPITCAIFDDCIYVIDPDIDETMLAKGYMTCILDSNRKIVYIKSNTTRGISSYDYDKIISMSCTKSQHILKHLV